MSRADKYEALRKLIQAFSEPYKGTLYHYTSADSISGIIHNHEIWMSNTTFMNDTTELKALENATGILKDNDFTNDAVKERWHEMVDRTRTNEMTEPDYYMASFSRKKDSLEQWRAYGNFCIGFDARKLALRRHQFLYKCLYTENDIRKWILAKERIPEWTSLPEEHRDNAAYNLLYVASMKYKNKHFRAEKEIRLVATSHHNWFYAKTPGGYEDDLPIHFRPHRLFGFVPYLKFFIERKSNNRPQGTQETETQMKERKLKEEAAKQRELLPITEVIVGPMARQREAKTACEILLSERGYKQVSVNLSGIPYRGL
ncbi:MAG TPA: DUF2971 domain-containing protein [Candidatus Acidoferrum sp.]|nr:DUF2971 domain-containing protein [Candidatus Acidoferrum sp.]